MSVEQTASPSGAFETIMGWLATPRGRALAWFALFYLLLIAYFPALHAPFIYDDLPSIRDNADLRQPDALLRLFDSHKGALQFDRRPVGGIVTLINFQLFGTAVFWYHAVNLLIHWATAILIGEFALLLAKRLGAARPSDGFFVAFASLWALHPINSVTVIFTYQRMESLMALFFVLALYCLLRSADSARGGRWMVCASAAAMLSVLSKENGAVVLFAMLLLDRLFLATSWRALWLARGKAYCGFALVWLAAIIWIISGERAAEVAAGDAALTSPINYFKLQCRVIIEYLGLTLWPDRLTFIYAPRFVDRPMQWLPSAILLVLILAVSIKAGARYRWLWFAAPLFYLLLGPTSSFLPVPLEPKAEWRMYLPSACVILVLMACFAKIATAFDFSATVRGSLVAVLGASLLARTHFRSRDYATPVRIWEDTALKEPFNTKAWGNLGFALLETGEKPKVAACIRALEDIARRHDDRYASATANSLAGWLLLDQQRYAEAHAAFSLALERDPSDMRRIRELARCLVKLGKYTQGLADIRQYLASYPDDVEALVILAESQAGLGQIADASVTLDRCERLSPGNPRVAELRDRLKSQDK